MNNTKLTNLANIFSQYTTLYAVGGCIRDSILQIASGDIDVCSSMPAEKVRDILKGSEFTVQDRDLRMGTIIITSHGFKAEYTTFRTDSYEENSGEHRPSNVKFTDDIHEDMLRRDFTCNSLYLDILKDEILDFCGGQNDIANKVVKCVTNPAIVFEADGLRILRMVRFASELGFEIDDETLQAAKENVWRIKDLSCERIRDELDKIFIADTAHGRKFLMDGLISGYSGPGNDGTNSSYDVNPEDYFGNAHYRGIKLLDEIGALEIILPEVTNLKGLTQNVKWHIYDGFNHTLEVFRVSAPDIRWAALLHDIGKRPCFDRDGNTYQHATIGADMAQDICTRLRFPKIKTRDICALIRSHMYDMDRNTRIGKLRWFIAERARLIPQLVELIAADAFGSGKVRANIRIQEVYEDMKREGVPLSIKELKVDGRDLINLDYPECVRGMTLYELWKDTVMNGNLNDREHALEYLKNKRGKR